MLLFQINVNIPKLTRGNQDWLYSSAPTSHVSTPSHVMAERFQFPPFQADLNTWLAKHEEVSTPSIQQWLSYIKHEPEVEEDDFEMISHEHKNSGEYPCLHILSSDTQYTLVLVNKYGRHLFNGNET